MTPQDHNKTLGIIYGFLGGILSVAALIELIRVMTIEKELARVRSDTSLQVLIIVGLALTIVLLSTAYELFRRMRWARMSSLILAGLFIWLVPLGTALAIYSWWFLQSEGARQIYPKHSP